LLSEQSTPEYDAPHSHRPLEHVPRPEQPPGHAACAGHCAGVDMDDELDVTTSEYSCELVTTLAPVTRTT